MFCFVGCARWGILFCVAIRPGFCMTLENQGGQLLRYERKAIAEKVQLSADGKILAEITTQKNTDARSQNSISDKAASAAGLAQSQESPEDETTCKLVSKRGIMYMCDVYPLQPKSDAYELSLLQDNASFETQLNSEFGTELNSESLDAEHYVSEMRKLGDGAIVYVVTTALPVFRDHVLPRVKSSFVLVTGDAVKAPEQMLGEDFTEFAEDPRILKWFAQNSALAHPKIVPLAIGLDYQTLKASSRKGWGKQATPREQEKQLWDVRQGAPSFEQRMTSIHDGAFGIVAADRENRETILHELQQQPNVVHISEHFPTRETFWADVAKYRFASSPRGVGIDCHRTWELLILGVVPLLQAGPHNRLYHENDLPIVEIEEEEWRHLDSDVVQRKLDNASNALAANRKYPNSLPPALTLKYWVDRIRGAVDP